MLTTLPPQLFRLRKKFFEGIASFAQIPMSKTWPDRFERFGPRASADNGSLERVPMGSNRLATVMPAPVVDVNAFVAGLQQARRGWPDKRGPNCAATVRHGRDPSVTVWSLRDAVCWPGRKPEETTRESSCWLRRGGDCRCGIARLVDRLADTVELGRGIPPDETIGSCVPRSPRPRSRHPGKDARFAFAVGLAGVALAALA